MSTTKKEKKFFECKLCKPGEAVFKSKSAISAHINHGHKKKLADEDYIMTDKTPRPTLYSPVSKSVKKKKIGGSINSQSNGTIDIPIILRIPFHFENPKIIQDEESKTIDLSLLGRKRKG